MGKKLKEKRKEIVISGVVLVIMFILYKLNIFKFSNPEEFKDYIQSFGVWAPIVYIVLFTVVPLTLFPDSILAISGGLAFGIVWGSIYTMIGALMGGTLAFFITRTIGNSAVNKLMDKKFKGAKKYTDKMGVEVILLLRLIPLFPFDIVSYLAGLSNIKFRKYIFGTIIGTIPGILIFNNIGEQIMDCTSFGFIVSIILLVLLFLISFIFKNKLSKI
ncbi:TVP38/TMEM64 family protein [Oceanirhabdus seepicola]|uniref:TVP38/TMEM64 family membrane protein n=1 Tax=Oceanirhabdus seepicola TaxID=2828781 RepID=A0A9J6P6N6_9CLOT|nr:TVP38/TMEM64 family protein [Oceanirhabdus seepicola]MCM1991916.1 TVP38/TMEM64 family protein [Oceanirhabdus seepicola]